MSVWADILQRFFRLLFSTVIRMFPRQGLSRVYGVFEVGRPRLNDYACLGEPFFIKLPVAYFLLCHFFACFFFNQQPQQIYPEVPLPRPFEEEPTIWSFKAQFKRLCLSGQTFFIQSPSKFFC